MARKIWYIAVGATVAVLVMLVLGYKATGVISAVLFQLQLDGRGTERAPEGMIPPAAVAEQQAPSGQKERESDASGLEISDEEILALGNVTVELPRELDDLIRGPGSSASAPQAENKPEPERPAMSPEEHRKFVQQQYDEALRCYRSIFALSQ